MLKSKFFKDNIKLSLLKKIFIIGITEVRLNTSNKEFMNKKITNIKMLFQKLGKIIRLIFLIYSNIFMTYHSDFDNTILCLL